MAVATRIDPVTLEVLRSALPAIANEMSVDLQRTSYNMMIYEVQDYCCALLDVEGRLISQNIGGVSHFVADLGVVIKDAVAQHGRDGFAPGDVLITNHQRVAGQHLNNICVYTPFFFQGELLGFCIVRAHWVDVGGMSTGFGAMGLVNDPWMEGLQLDQIKLYEGGVPDPKILKVIADNIRFPESSMGDLRSQMAACKLAERRLEELFSRYGRETLLSGIERIFNETEVKCRAIVERIPDGEYEASATFDHDFVDRDTPIPLHVRVVVHGSDMTIDFTRCSLAVRGAINSRTLAGAYIAYKGITGPLDPVNEGSFRALEVDIQEGNIMMARYPAPMAGWSLILPTVVDMVLKALGPALPDQIPAAHLGTLGGALAFFGYDQAKRRNFVLQTIEGGGWGGRPWEDGEDASVSVCQGDVRNAPVEAIELKTPVLIERRALRSDSGGPGTYRGGLGMETIAQNLVEGRWNLSNAGRTIEPPWGLWGGKSGRKAGNQMQRPDEPALKEAIAFRQWVPAGTRVAVQTAAGGGWGNPFERDPAAVLNDVIEGYVSLESAERDYGVAIKDGQVDMESTLSQRSTIPSPAAAGEGIIRRKEKVLTDVKADLQQRLALVQAKMREERLDTLIVYDSGQHNMLRMNQVFYLTDFRSIGPVALIVPASGATKLLVTPAWDVERAREAAGVNEATASKDLAQAIRAEAKGTVALSGRDVMPMGLFEGLPEMKDGEKLIPSFGATRTPVELERVTRAAQIADIGFEALCATAKVGLREYELTAEIEAAMQAAGSEDNFGLLGAGSHNIAIRPPTERRLEAGDLIIGEITPCYQGHFAQLCRTYILGDPSEVQRQKFDMLLEAQDRGFEAAIPGRSSANIAKAVNGVIGAAGYPEYCRQPYMRTRGHGLGFGGVVPYDVTEDSSPVLQENMTFVIHPNQYIPETGYMMLGDTVVIEARGPRCLTLTPRRLFWKS